ncbi:hypothetical protein GH5_08157 [Leishmania sp. Ghana 2012 LV757]|uniref:hypothetical protein n=1 Tax=Leishmania sp. Ghana 2012 LV757 TaxID=2803181 RepID=UPI001B582BAC|nr:hypothetical protein GH5_08157 [Leishmania sp. Ghana 2012 LV757]
MADLPRIARPGYRGQPKGQTLGCISCFSAELGQPDLVGKHRHLQVAGSLWRTSTAIFNDADIRRAHRSCAPQRRRRLWSRFFCFSNAAGRPRSATSGAQRARGRSCRSLGSGRQRRRCRWRQRWTWTRCCTSQISRTACSIKARSGPSTLPARCASSTKVEFEMRRARNDEIVRAVIERPTRQSQATSGHRAA